MVEQVLAVVFAPLAAWCLVAPVTLVRRRNPGESAGRLSAAFGITAVAVSFLLAVGLLRAVGNGAAPQASWPWLMVGSTTIALSVGLDLVSAVMLVVVTAVSLLVQVYSLGYLHGDSHVPRYYANLSLFTFAMLLLLVARDYLLLLMAWELMGLCSYLLIGHYFTTPAAQKASTKAFLITRLGDVGLFLALLVLFQEVGSFQYDMVFGSLAHLPQAVSTLVALGLFAAAAGKSAQLPLHLWLPDAMAGPTPVSALIHAATMVAAGVYLVARSLPLFVASGAALVVVAYVGGATAFYAATRALIATDLKRVLAYSTISQLGYMMLALGAGSRESALFHLMTHAFFKAMLFLAAGVIIHTTHTQDIRRLGGLWRSLPAVAVVFLLGGAALAGIPPFSGYFSKEAILAAVATASLPGLLPLALLTVGLTGFYTFRVYHYTFLGRPAGDAEAAHGHPEASHRTAPTMLWPLLVLAVPTVLGGFLGSGWAAGGDPSHLAPAAEAAGAGPADAGWVGWVALLLAVGGVGVAAALYATRGGSSLRQKGLRTLKGVGLASLLNRGATAARALVVDGWGGGLLRLAGVFDRRVIDPVLDSLAAGTERLSRQVARCDTDGVDGAVNGLASLVVRFGRRTGRLETGYLTDYLFAFLVGLVVFLTAAGALA